MSPGLLFPLHHSPVTPECSPPPTPTPHPRPRPPHPHSPPQLVAVDTPLGRLGLTTCYDLRFPEMYQALTWELGAQLLLVPSAFTQVTGGQPGGGRAAESRSSHSSLLLYAALLAHSLA